MEDRLGHRMPPNLVKGIVLVPGGAFRRHWEYGAEGKKWRYFFILNRAPETDDHLVIVTATTQIEKAFKCFCHKALVTVDPKEYPSLERRSVINCSLPEEKTKEELIRAIERGEVCCLAPLPDSILAKVRKAIETATTVTPRLKRLVLGEDDCLN